MKAQVVESGIEGEAVVLVRTSAQVTDVAVAASDAGRVLAVWVQEFDYDARVVAAEFEPVAGWGQPFSVDTDGSYASTLSVAPLDTSTFVVVWGPGWEQPLRSLEVANGSAGPRQTLSTMSTELLLEGNGSSAPILIESASDLTARSFSVGSGWSEPEILDEAGRTLRSISVTNDGDALLATQGGGAGAVFGFFDGEWSGARDVLTGADLEYVLDNELGIALSGKGTGAVLWNGTIAKGQEFVEGPFLVDVGRGVLSGRRRLDFGSNSSPSVIRPTSACNDAGSCLMIWQDWGQESGGWWMSGD